MGGLWADSGRIVGGSCEDSGRILVGLQEDVRRILGGFWKDSVRITGGSCEDLARFLIGFGEDSGRVLAGFGGWILGPPSEDTLLRTSLGGRPHWRTPLEDPFEDSLLRSTPPKKQVTQT